MFAYPELGIEISESSGPDTTGDQLSFSDANGTKIVVENSLCHYPQSIQVASTSLGIKKTDKLDFTVMLLEKESPAAGVFTKSMTASPTVPRNKKICSEGYAQAIIVNSGNANVFTPNGEKDLEHIVSLVASEFGIHANKIISCSTGVIGVPMPVALFDKGIPGLKSRLGKGKLDEASKAILTTDVGPKVASVKIGEIVICGMIKGAGMIEPNMATMLGYIFTNAKLSPKQLQKALQEASSKSFNCISVDSDTSTSDTVTFLSTDEVELSDSELFQKALNSLCIKLARDVVSQGEGVTKIIECCVQASNADFAKRVAKKIINSPLIKTAVHGSDPNWGRVVMAVGKPDAIDQEPIAPEHISIWLQGEKVFDRMNSCETDLKALSLKMKEARRATIEVVIGEPVAIERSWGCDLTDAYIRINADYTT